MASQAAFEDSNIALLSSALNHELKVDAAKKEKAFEGVGSKIGLEVFRIEKFQVHKWPKEKQGTFYSGDAYIVLNTYKLPEQKSDKFNYDVFFWLGSGSTQDEQGTAAYKTVEIDDLLGGAPVQHREVQGYESEEFKNLFPALMYLDGGVDSGFNPVKPEAYQPRLLQVVGKKHPQVFSRPLELASLNDGDTFILDAGLSLFQWNGKTANVDEKKEAGKIVQMLKAERSFKPKSVILDGLEDDADFWKFFGGKPSAVNPPHAADPVVKSSRENYKLFRLSDSDPSKGLQLTKLSEGAAVKRDQLNSDDVFLLDLGHQVFSYVGKNASKQEKTKAILYATKYLVDEKKPAHTPIVRIIEGSHSAEFEAAFQ